jgi:hypothetical protein
MSLLQRLLERADEIKVEIKHPMSLAEVQAAIEDDPILGELLDELKRHPDRFEIGVAFRNRFLAQMDPDI